MFCAFFLAALLCAPASTGETFRIRKALSVHKPGKKLKAKPTLVYDLHEKTMRQIDALVRKVHKKVPDFQ